MPSRPNVLLVVLDAVRADHLSCYGYARPTTPALDRLAATGVLFEQAFAAAPWTPPSHASLFTGTYPSWHRVDVDENLHLDGRYPTLAEILASLGYATFAVLPDAHLSRTRGLHRGFAEFVEMFRIPYVSPDYHALVSGARSLLAGRDGRAYHASRLLKKWIGAHVRRSRQPFFAFVNYKTAHSSYRSPRSFRRRFAIRPDPDQDRARLRAYANGAGYLYMADGLPMTERDLAVVRSWYDGAIASLDDRVGDLLDFLRQVGVYEDTLVVVTADHGENFGDHGLAYHLFCLYDSLIRVPLLLHVPGLRPAGRRLRTLVSLTDVLPTVLELIGADARQHPGIQGASLAAFDDREVHPYVFAEFGRPHYMLKRLSARYPRHDFSRFDRGLRCIRSKDDKLIVGTDGTEELYHLPSDPGETKNRAGERPEVVRPLARALDDWLAGPEPVALAPSAPDDDALMRKTLQELGYF